MVIGAVKDEPPATTETSFVEDDTTELSVVGKAPGVVMPFAVTPASFFAAGLLGDDTTDVSSVGNSAGGLAVGAVELVAAFAGVSAVCGSRAPPAIFAFSSAAC